MKSRSSVGAASEPEKNHDTFTSSARLIECSALIEGVDMPRSTWDRWPTERPAASDSSANVMRFALRSDLISCPSPPTDMSTASGSSFGLRMRKLLDGVRGAPAVNIDALAERLAKFSVLVSALAGSFCEIDVNPVIADHAGAIAVDALVVGGRGAEPLA